MSVNKITSFVMSNKYNVAQTLSAEGLHQHSQGNHESIPTNRNAQTGNFTCKEPLL